MKKQIIICINEFEERGALMVDEKLEEFFIQRKEEGRVTKNIYQGRIANILPGMEAIFVDIGMEKNAFLHFKDASKREFKIGEEIVVQVVKEPRGDKGARVTMNYTLPGKYLILVPNNNHIAISKKIGYPKDRERLKDIFQEIGKGDYGVIVRTESARLSPEELEKEYNYLISKWERVEDNFKRKKTGEQIYEDNDLVTRIVRDVFSQDIDELIVDDEEKYWEIVEYVKTFGAAKFKTKVKLFQSSLNIFDHYNVSKDLEEGLGKRVWLDCGGYIIIEETEALVSIDVNTGRNIGKSNLGATILETNIEAAKEIGRQLRIRNLSGIIIIDFIDMRNEKDKVLLYETLEEELSRDRIQTNIAHYTSLGLIEMTRKREGKPLSKYYLEECNYCQGSGVIKSKENVTLDILREIRELAEEEDISKIVLETTKEVKSFIKKNYLNFIVEYLRIRGKVFENIGTKESLNSKYQIKMEK